eukprot:CAMPEP_0202695500 /NCGR_PEP_ID=MMETSP1385-20130828/9087_1 /ASSEMBLY_ACC=CAM_ASM_000861 /TAXON_ID=933848 /ORGANISM="Elphidium margaritaceum" /LENGTH=348 /DNA_ID=CAMNT_0049351537 /DNA_START=33 /DNA_END=1079 /DNA_ORIENTATION=+
MTASLYAYAYFTLFLVCAYIVLKTLQWFFAPFIIDFNDDSPALRSYRFIDPRNQQSHPFPSIHDAASKSISLVFPAYNEEQRLRQCMDPTIAYLQGLQQQRSTTFTWEIIVVDDGSNDTTADIVQTYVAKYGTDHIRLLSYKKNQGKGFAVQQGMLHARGHLVLFADADGASEITCLDRLEQAMFDALGIDDRNDYAQCGQSFCITIGSRAHLQQRAEAERTVLRNILMHGFHFVVKWVGNVHGISDTQCGFKLFTRRSVIRTVLLQRIRRWCFDPELLMLAQRQHIPVLEVAIKWQEIEGSKIQPLTASFNMLRELILVRLCSSLGVWYQELNSLQSQSQSEDEKVK